MHSHRIPILKPDRTYTFHSYFRMKYPVDEILQELGTSFSIEPIAFPESVQEIDALAPFKLASKN